MVVRDKMLEFLDSSNIYKQLGYFSLGDIGEYSGKELCFDEEIKTEDIVLCWDYSDDDISEDNEEVNKFNDWLDNMFMRVNDMFSKFGYERIHDNDGSGGGLYYGVEIYRKK